jgi:hypothetical protein
MFSGTPPREAQLWAALHSTGPGAVLSHQTAAELFRLIDQPSSLIHVTVPAPRHIDRATGVIIHRSTRLDEARHPSLLPPRTRIEETVLDLVQQPADFDAAFDWACRACQRRLTKADLLASAMTRRNRLRWRADLAAALADIGEGVHSLLEYRYVRDVERRHGLPAADRQARARRGYLDNLDEEYQVCVELDGRATHPDDRRWQDIHRTTPGPRKARSRSDTKARSRSDTTGPTSRSGPVSRPLRSAPLSSSAAGPAPSAAVPAALPVADDGFQTISLQDHPRWVQWCTGGARGWRRMGG